MGIILNLETATTNCSVSLAKNGELLALKEQNTPNFSHAEKLHVFISEVLHRSGLKMEQVDAIAVSKGPGSYTGLRIGVSAAKGLCFALGVPLISISTLKSMAYQVITDEIDFIIPVLDARRMEVYSAVFDTKGNQVRETKAEIIEESSFGEFAKKHKVLLAGSGADKCKPVLTHANFDFTTEVVPSAREMSLLSHQKYVENRFEDVAYFEPFYLKDFIVQGGKKT
ncbi:tRNA (adenosine(37)-N6)-threonylcarbamoyltransferase complex dimerization subunit type 1 TsaB [Maribacter algicola]|uniref:tRNA (Adenosine(37)-N6)-threonylcarbamoyltransferase complex dimerization subunit type 1 TsaB n=1 Tax=Meishania litoralis TaxID=3434685 RepID=A0ACC7LLB6_9FLAO